MLGPDTIYPQYSLSEGLIIGLYGHYRSIHFVREIIVGTALIITNITYKFVNDTDKVACFQTVPVKVKK